MGKEIGIDFGTTNTVVSYIGKKGKLRQLKYDNATIIPTVIYFFSKEKYIIGEKAKKIYEFKKNKAGVDNFKPIIGDDERKEIISEDNQVFYLKPKDLAKIFLNEVVRGMQDKLINDFGVVDGCVDAAVITVPAKFNAKEKENIRKAARSAGLHMAKLAAEPTAAAIAYQDDSADYDIEEEHKAILVYDFGGGTFDVSIINKENGKFREIATDGDKRLGGKNLTYKIAEHLLDLINSKYNMELPIDEDEFDEDTYGISEADYRKNLIAIYNTANDIKEKLSDFESVEESCNIIDINKQDQTFDYNFYREDIEKIIEGDIRHTIDITRNAISEARDKGFEVGKIVLAGGSSNIPLVKQLLEKEVIPGNIAYKDDVSTLISRGATLLAGVNNVGSQITNAQLGVAATEGIQYGKFQMIIPANENLPCSKKRNFNLAQDGQKKLEIPYYERDIKNYPNAIRIDDDGINEVDRLIIDNLPDGLKKEEVIVEVTFDAQIDGSLNISAIVKDINAKEIKQAKIIVMKESDLE